jgi:hypothetical protein
MSGDLRPCLVLLRMSRQALAGTEAAYD